jgi:hypothetical protein
MLSLKANLIERHQGVISLAVRNNPNYVSFRFADALTLDAAYASPATLFDRPVGSTFRSKTLRLNGINRVLERNAGLTRVVFDPVDYASATVPGEGQPHFIRVAGIDTAGGVSPFGPILVVPKAGFLSSGRRSLILNGTAPNVAGLASNLPPQDAMWVDLSEFADEIEVFNTDGANDLFFSMGPGTQEILIASGSSKVFKQAGASLVSFRGDGATASFSMTAVLVNGIQG